MWPLDRCSCSEMEDLYRGKFWPPKSNTSCTLLVIPGHTRGTVFELVQPLQQPHVEYQIISSKPWAAGPVMLIKSTLEPPSHQLYRLPASYCSRRYVTVNWTVRCLRFLWVVGLWLLPQALLPGVALGDSLQLGRGLMAGCGYCWPRKWFHPAGVGLLASCSYFGAPNLHLR